MRIAAANYAIEKLATWAQYEEKQRAWVAEAARAGAELLVFPEYGRMELAALDGADVASDPERAMRAVAEYAERADTLLCDLALEYVDSSGPHGLFILGPGGPVWRSDAVRPVNSAWLFGPPGGTTGYWGFFDKQIMTPYERDELGMVPGGPMRVVETELGRIGVLVCYDAEFPLLARALVACGIDILLVPSCTDTLAGHHRVRIAARARALEGQCVVALAATTGAAPWCPVVDENHGAGGVYGPPDLGFPETGVIAQGEIDVPGWVYADIDLDQISRVRREGAVRNWAHWPESEARATMMPRPKSGGETDSS